MEKAGRKKKRERKKNLQHQWSNVNIIISCYYTVVLVVLLLYVKICFSFLEKLKKTILKNMKKKRENGGKTKLLFYLHANTLYFDKNM